eukprot:gnl/MRDRNA2_/MRDRNA2_138841_c0_seq1.p1 gnl/MRDRNA2_/MRDRNA2_138841_c0~~gnl/MRDRNA2_/MRDRNA2_138841_c0_seq1.p1  ORF type:complete len:190 (-),score=31.65 gnl/MRDRNA2_/MRDRNA2_138841_c0_seq1:319-888(-)
MAGCDDADVPPKRKSEKKRMSFSAEVELADNEDDLGPLSLPPAGPSDPSLPETGVHSIRFGFLRIANVYQTSLPIILPSAETSVEVCPFLSTCLEAKLESVDQKLSLVLTFSANREGQFSERMAIRWVNSSGEELGQRHIQVSGAVMNRDTGKPLPRRGILCISEGKPEDYNTDAGTEWEGFQKGPGDD